MAGHKRIEGPPDSRHYPDEADGQPQVGCWRIKRAHARPLLTLLPDDDDGIVVVMAFTYIARCADDTLYVGHAEELVSREAIHNRGHG